jgi:predicted nuclease with TOPRIM domain
MENFAILVLGFMLGIFVVGIIMSIVIVRKMSRTIKKMKKEVKIMKAVDAELLKTIEDRINDTGNSIEYLKNDMYSNLDLSNKSREEQINELSAIIDSKYDKISSKNEKSIRDLKNETAKLITNSFHRTVATEGMSSNGVTTIIDNLIENYRE